MIRAGAPDAVVHLAGMAFAPDAGSDPAEAFRVNVGGTVALFEALREIGIRPPVLVSCSADAYGAPRPEDLPLREDAPLAPEQSVRPVQGGPGGCRRPRPLLDTDSRSS